MSLREFDWISTFTSIAGLTARERVDEGVFPREFAGAPDDLVRILSSPDILHIVVCGDPHRNRLMVMEGGHTQPVSYTHLRAHETRHDLVCRLLLEKKKKK